MRGGVKEEVWGMQGGSAVYIVFGDGLSLEADSRRLEVRRPSDEVK